MSRPYPSYYIYLDERGEYRWRYQANNTKTLADSGEGYKAYDDCRNGITRMQQSANSPVWQSQEVADRRK